MPPLHDLLAALAGRPDASGALVVSDEGLVINAVLPPGIEAEAVAAHAATAYRSMRGLSTALEHGTPQQAVIESGHGILVLLHLAAGALLVVVASPGAELGELLYDLRRHGPAIAELV
jgi:predicted regulator of Ras-like GTPase activity (Roadblock/LC7/MglB family)